MKSKTREEPTAKKALPRVAGWRVEEALSRRVAVLAAAAGQPQVEVINRLLRTWSEAMNARLLLEARRGRREDWTQLEPEKVAATLLEVDRVTREALEAAARRSEETDDASPF